MKAKPSCMVDIFCHAICAGVRSEAPDLSARQMALLLLVSLDSELYTVRELALYLGISKPAVTRSLDRLENIGLTERSPDLRDRRSVLVKPTTAGMAYVVNLQEWMTKAVATYI